MTTKSKVEEALDIFKNIVAASAKINPRAKKYLEFARNALIYNEAELKITKGYGKVLAEKYFPLSFDPSKSFYSQGVDPRTIKPVS